MTTIQGRHGDDGSVLPLSAIVVAVVVVAAMMLVAIVDGSVRRARAQVAADAGALAAATVAHDSDTLGRQTAVELVESNGGELVEYQQGFAGDRSDVSQMAPRPFRVTIVADYQGVKAVATAERSVRADEVRADETEAGNGVEAAAQSPHWAIPAAGYADVELGAR